MLTVYVETVKDSGFTGYIYREELSPEYAALFPSGLSTINVEGDYFVSWKGKSPEISVENVLAYHGKVHIDIGDDDTDMYQIAAEIEKSDVIPSYEEAVADLYNEGDR